MELVVNEWNKFMGHWWSEAEAVVCCVGTGSATVRSLVQRSPIERDVSECDRETSTMRRPWHNRAVDTWKKINMVVLSTFRIMILWYTSANSSLSF